MSAAGAVPFVGRDAELAQLAAALDEARTDARFVVLEGEPGIGKTRLADELRRLATSRGSLAVWGRSDESGAAPALWPWLAPLRALADRTDTVAPALQELLAGEAPIAPGRAADIQFERFEAVADLLSRAGATAPVVVLLDDLQWADPASLELLGFLAGRIERDVLVIGTMRHLEVGRSDAVTDALAAIARRPGSRRIQLRGLTASATSELLGAVAASAPDVDVAATIHARSEGNPFYAIELARLLDAEGDPGAVVPASVRDVVRRRLSLLPPATVDLLGVAAVTGRDVELGLLVRAAGSNGDAALDDLEPAIVHRLLVDVPDQPSVFRFSHALVREVLLDDMSALRRARLHLKVADAMEAGGAGVDELELIAEHLWRAAPVGVGMRAAVALERAAEIAVRRVAYASAEDLLTKAVQLRRTVSVTDDDVAAELNALMQLLEVARARRYFQGAVNVDVINRAKELAQRCNEEDLYLSLLWFEFSSSKTSCRAAEADRVVRTYVELATDHPRPDVRASGFEVQAVNHWSSGRVAEAVELLDAAIELLDGVPTPVGAFDAEKLVVTHCFWAWMHAAHGDLPLDVVFERFDTLIADYPDRFVIATICGFAAPTAISVGDWAQLERFVEIGHEADPGAQFAFWGGQNLMQRAIVQARHGEIDEALQSFTEGKARYTDIGGRAALSTFEAALGMALAETGHAEKAKELVGDARAELDTWQERWNEPVVLLAEGVLAAALGDTTAAAERFASAVAVADAQGSHRIADRARAIAATYG